MTESEKYLWNKRDTHLHTARVSTLYHRKRERFFDLLDKCTKAATVLAGASLLSELVKDHLPFVAACISGAGLLSLVFGYSDRKQRHRELAESFALLCAEIEEAGEKSFTEAQLDVWAARIWSINAKEPPTLRSLAIICQNEISIADGHPAAVVPVSWYRRAVADFA